MTFHLTCVDIILVRFRLMSGYLFGNSCSFGKPYVFLLYFDYFYIQLYIVLILRLDLGSLIGPASYLCILLTLSGQFLSTLYFCLL